MFNFYSEFVPKDLTLYFHIDFYGYEELLLELAQNGTKIQLFHPQKLLFAKSKYAEHFQFDGKPDLILFIPNPEMTEYTVDDNMK